MGRLAATLVSVLLLLPISAPAGENPVLGTWKLQSFMREVLATGERYKEFGAKPDGYITYLPDGRMTAIRVRGEPREAGWRGANR